MNMFILLKTLMITDRTWMMIMILWPMLTLILSLRQLSSFGGWGGGSNERCLKWRGGGWGVITS